MKSPYRTDAAPGVLAALAAANLGAGLWLSARPARAEDLHAVVAWAGEWLAGANPYAPFDSVVDYPPWALAALSPLSLVPTGWLPPFWIAVNLALLGAIAARLVRRVDEPARVRWTLALLFAATASARTLSQFSLLGFTLAIAGGFSASRALGGLCIGLSLMKPQIGGVVLVWCLLRREWLRAAVAGAVALLLAGVFAFRAQIDPVTLFDQYARALTLVHGASEPLPGHTELRAWLHAVWPGQAGSLAMSAILAGGLLVPALLSSRRAPRDRDHELELLALCGCVSLLAVRHLSYDFILLWPALLAWRVPPFSVRPAAAGWAAAFALTSVLLVLALPGWVRLAVSMGWPTAALGLAEIDRCLALAAWLALSWRLLFARDLK